MPRMISLEDLQDPTDTEESSGWRDQAYLKGIHGPSRTRRPKVVEQEDPDEELDIDEC